MCGIAGLLDRRGTVDRARLEAMDAWLRNRGPDDAGLEIHGGVGFAHRRLSIVDLSPTGHQPMRSRSGRSLITFNGEIYNYKELRGELARGGVSFRGTSDTEVLLEGLEVWGADELLRRADGMFALAVYDFEAQELTLARDRFGKKPLYYEERADDVAFSSDIRSIWSLRDDLEVDTESLDYYLTELSTPQPRTIWRGVRQVEPASAVTFSSAPATPPTHRRYWDLPRSRSETLPFQEAEELTLRELESAVKKRLHGDVPVGAFLSGGLDSGIVTALLARSSSETIQTFTIGFDYEEWSELPAARQVAERYATDHHEVVLDARVAEELPSLVDAFGEPFADSSAIPTYLMSREIAGSVKVALSGDGGDELFGGYFEFPIALRADELLDSYPGRTTRSLAVQASRVLSRLGIGRNLAEANEFLEMSGHQRLYRRMGFSEAHKRALYTPEQAEASNGYAAQWLDRVWNDAPGRCLVERLFRSNIDTRLLNDYLVKLDRASMRSSLEVRSPFLDTQLAEALWSLPGRLHLQGGTGKALLRGLAGRLLGAEALERPKKGFSLPLGPWLRGDLADFTREILLDPRALGRDLFQGEEIERLVRSHVAGHKDHTHRIWALLCLELWFQRFVDQTPVR